MQTFRTPQPLVLLLVLLLACCLLAAPTYAQETNDSSENVTKELESKTTDTAPQDSAPDAQQQDAGGADAPKKKIAPPSRAGADRTQNKVANYVPLVGIPGLSLEDNSRTLADYLNILFRLAIGIAALIAVLKIAFAGIKYMGRDSFFAKEDAKNDIQNALFGLLIILSIVVLLNTIYPGARDLNIFGQLEPIRVESNFPEEAPRRGATGVTTQETQEGAATPIEENLRSDQEISSSQTLLFALGSVQNPEVTKARRAFRDSCDGQYRQTQITEKNANGNNEVVGLNMFCVTSTPQENPAEPGVTGQQQRDAERDARISRAITDDRLVDVLYVQNPTSSDDQERIREFRSSCRARGLDSDATFVPITIDGARVYCIQE